MKIFKSNIVSYYELSEEWDLSECMAYKGETEGFKYNAGIGISNNSAMLLMIDDNMESCEYIFV